MRITGHHTQKTPSAAQRPVNVSFPFMFLREEGLRVQRLALGSWKGLGGWGQGQAGSHNGLELSLTLGSHLL